MRSNTYWKRFRATVLPARWLIGMIGLISAVIATMSGRVQSNIKGRIGYASIAQVGLMFIELSLGFTNLALLHLITNACLRCYQLLVSPSVVAQILRLQSQSGPDITISDWSPERLLPARVRSSLYAFAFNEGYLETLLRAGIFVPLDLVGKRLNRLFFHQKSNALFILLLVLITVVCLRLVFAPTYFGAVGVAVMVICALVAFYESQDAFFVFHLVAVSCLASTAAVIGFRQEAKADVLVYLAGILPGYLLGLFALQKLRKKEQVLSLRTHYGLAESEPLGSFLLLLSFLCISGFPISPAFIGEDLILHYATGEYAWLALLITLAFVLNGVTLARLFSFLCLGPSKTPSAPAWSKYSKR